MKPIGKVMNVTSGGSIVVRSKGVHDIGSTVVDRGSGRIGRISRITGPVSSPYVIITASPEARDRLDRLIGRQVFLQEKRERERGDRDRRPKQGGNRSPDRKRDNRSDRRSPGRTGRSSRPEGGRIGTGRVHKVRSVKKRK